jgi:hypothetical protein
VRLSLIEIRLVVKQGCVRRSSDDQFGLALPACQPGSLPFQTMLLINSDFMETPNMIYLLLVQGRTCSYLRLMHAHISQHQCVAL